LKLKLCPAHAPHDLRPQLSAASIR
jgi:hypothetical protein